MSTDRDATRIVRLWLRTDENDSADRVLGTVLSRLDTTPQRRATRWPRRLFTMDSGQRTAVAAAVVALAILGLSYFAVGRVGAPAATASPSASAEASALAFPSLPALRMPPTRPNAPAGEYGWEGRAGEPIEGMHLVLGEGAESREVTSILFATGPDCLVRQDAGPGTPARVAGMSATVIDAYTPTVAFGGPEPGDVTRAHALAVADRTLCVYVTWNLTTTEEEIRSALDVLETIRAQPIGADGVRITFTLPAGWDTG